MPTPTWTRIVIGLAGVIGLAAALAMDAPVDAKLLKPAGIVMGAVVLLLLAFDRWAWKWVPMKLTGRPNLHGTWKGSLEYRWPAGEPAKTKDCYLVIRQTYSLISVDMLFDISTSHSSSAAIGDINGTLTLSWSYWSAARLSEREDNAPHRGAAQAVISVEPKVSLDGEYWTDRTTVGRIRTHGRTKKLYRDYSNARAAAYS